MAVAKTYSSLEILTEPYEKENGRKYVEVRLKSGKPKEVRWYTDAEYARLYPEAGGTITIPQPEKPHLKKALGFDEGYITIFKGDQETNNDWFRLSNARYHSTWGWYVVSTEETPNDLPFGIEPIKLYWKDITTPVGNLKPEDTIKAIVTSLLYGESSSVFVGEVGERLDLILKVEKAIPFDGAYGKTTIHIMHDDCGNEFVWTTAAKTLVVDTEYEIRGSIKDHRVYKGTNQTILTRCTIKK
jgi:hypothetical protein